MERTNELLYKVINNRLDQAVHGCDNDKENTIIFKEAIEAYKQHLELLKIENARIKAEQEFEIKQIEVENAKIKTEKELDVKKMEAENAKIQAENELKLKRKEGIRDSVIKTVEIVGIVLVTPMIGYATKKAFAQMLCLFEKDYTFTTIPGRSLSGLFKFKD
jgi:hypothetical protein